MEAAIRQGEGGSSHSWLGIAGSPENISYDDIEDDHEGIARGPENDDTEEVLMKMMKMMVMVVMMILMRRMRMMMLTSQTWVEEIAMLDQRSQDKGNTLKHMMRRRRMRRMTMNLMIKRRMMMMLTVV